MFVLCLFFMCLCCSDQGCDTFLLPLNVFMTTIISLLLYLHIHYITAQCSLEKCIMEKRLLWHVVFHIRTWPERHLVDEMFLQQVPKTESWDWGIIHLIINLVFWLTLILLPRGCWAHTGPPAVCVKITSAQSIFALIYFSDLMKTPPTAKKLGL